MIILITNETGLARIESGEADMIISAKQGRKLISEGVAGNAGFVWGDGVDHNLTQPEFVAIDRFDLQRTDHFKIDSIGIEQWIKQQSN